MSDTEISFRLDVRRLETSNTQWAFYVLDQDDRNWSGELKETYATRREAAYAGEAALRRLASKPPEQLVLQLELVNRQALRE